MGNQTRPATAPPARAGRVARAGLAAHRLPATSYFLTSAVFHYLGPSFAVLLFSRVGVLGVAWLRIASAGVVFAVWRRPWRLLPSLTVSQRRVLFALGGVLAAMNSVFYLAIARLPLSTVGAIEFLGTVALAALGARTRRNAVALLLVASGVALLTTLRLGGQPSGFVYAFANCGGFMLYVILGHRVANTAAGPAPAAGPGCMTGQQPMSGIDQLGMAMIIAAVLAAPAGVPGALPVFAHPLWLCWGIGVGVCSSVIPYVTDQLAMARLPRATFALMLALLPLFATVIGAAVLRQIPTGRDLAGIGLVVAGLALHRGPSHPDRGPSRSGGSRPEGRNHHAVRAPGRNRTGRVADRPRHDELRRPGQPGMGATGR